MSIRFYRFGKNILVNCVFLKGQLKKALIANKIFSNSWNLVKNWFVKEIYELKGHEQFILISRQVPFEQFLKKGGSCSISNNKDMNIL